MDEKLFLEAIPTDVYTGRVWIKYSTGQSYIRLGSDWIPLASSGTVTDIDRFLIIMSGQDITCQIQRGSLTIDDILNQEDNVCSFVMIDSDGTNKPLMGEEVYVFYRTAAGATPTLIYGGRVTNTPAFRVSPGIYGYEVACSDFTQDLRRLPVVGTYTGQLAGDIIKDVVQSYVPYIGTVNVDDGIEIEEIAFNYKYASEIIQQLADLIGYSWYVDYEKNIHFFERSTNVAPYTLTDDISDGEYSELNISVDKTQLKNAQTVRGGFEFSDLFSQIRVADGEQTSFNLDYEPYTPITVEVDVGGGYVAKTLGIDNIDTTGFDFVVNVSEKNIKNLDLATLASGAVVRIKYKYKKPILAYVDDETSIAAMKSIEGGDGVYEGALIIDEKIETKESARLRAQSEIDQYANPLVEGTFLTTQHGYKSGQLLTVNIPSRGINTTYLIRQVTLESKGGGLVEYSVTFATKLKGLTEFLVDLYNASRGEFQRTDEVLDRLKIVSSEELYVADSGLSESRRDTTTTPYVWSDDGGTTAGKGKYNLCSWG